MANKAEHTLPLFLPVVLLILLDLKCPLAIFLHCFITAQILLLIHNSPDASLFSETGKRPRNKSPGKWEKGGRHLKTLTISAGRRLPGKGGLWGRLGAAQSSAQAVSAAVCSKQASASPRPGLSLGSGEKAEREQLFTGSPEWAPETIPEDSGLKDNPQWG